MSPPSAALLPVTVPSEIVRVSRLTMPPPLLSFQPPAIVPPPLLSVTVSEPSTVMTFPLETADVRLREIVWPFRSIVRFCQSGMSRGEQDESPCGSEASTMTLPAAVLSICCCKADQEDIQQAVTVVAFVTVICSPGDLRCVESPVTYEKPCRSADKLPPCDSFSFLLSLFLSPSMND